MMETKYGWATEIKWFSFARLLFSKRFRFWLGQTILYALNNYNHKRGDGASDALVFERRYAHKIFNHEN